MKKTLNIKNLYTHAWHDYKSYWKQFLLIGLIFLIVGFFGNWGTGINSQGISMYPLLQIIVFLLQVFLCLGFIKFILNIIDKKQARLEDLFEGPENTQHFISFLVVSILVSSMSGILLLPTILSFLSGLFTPIVAWIVGTVFSILLITVVVGFIFAKYLVAEKRFGIFESLKESWKKTRFYQWSILLVIVSTFIFNIIGLLMFVVGLAVTIPMTLLIFLRIYRSVFNCDGKDNNCIYQDDIEIKAEEVLKGNHTK